MLRELAGRESGDPSAWRTGRLASPLILTVAFAASIGGLATPLGTPPNLIGIGLIESTLHRRIGFFEWMKMGAPAAAVLLILLVAYFARGSAVSRGPAWSLPGAWIREQRARLGPWSPAQIRVAAVFATAIALWTLPGFLGLVLGLDSAPVRWCNARLPEGAVALLAAGLLFLLPSKAPDGARLLVWPDAARIDWGSILLFGGGMALGELMFSTGLARWLGEGMAAGLPAQSAASLTVLFVLAGLLVSEATSNTASATMMIPLAIAMSQGAGVDPLHPALGACLGCSLGFMLPVSTPPNALAYGTGAVPLTTMIRHGLGLDLAGALVVIVAVLLLGP